MAGLMPYSLYQTPTYYSTNASTINSGFIVWPQWNNGTQVGTLTSGNLFSVDPIWQEWINTGTQFQSYPWQDRVVDRVQRHDERQSERQAARIRARTLLEDFLSDEQKADLGRHGHFTVIGSKGGRYRIRTRGQSGNVDLLAPNGEVQAILCAHPREYLPDGDAWLMQMIELRHDEDHFLATANVHRGELPRAA
jgi:hypothetical protein